MNAPDVNLLLYAHNRLAPEHKAARQYLEQELAGKEAFGIPLPCVHGFVRIATGTAFGRSRLAMKEALAIVDTWLAVPKVSILLPGPNHWLILRDLIGQTGGQSNLFSDAVIAAIAIEHGAVIHTTDGDFARLPGLRWLNPLA